MCQNATIQLTKEIDITGKSFSFSCDPSSFIEPNNHVIVFYSCEIVGTGNRMISGAPSSAKFENIDFWNGTSDNGGIAFLTGGFTKFSKCSFHDNNSTGNGGVLSIVGGKAVLNKCNFYFNKALGNGGVISAIGASTVVEGYLCKFYCNIANDGGAFYVVDGATVVLYDSSIGDNNATRLGGGIFLRNGKISSYNFRFRPLPYVGFYGNSIWVADDENPRSTGSELSCSFVDVCVEIAELAEGPNNTQLFNNTDNCVFNSTRRCGVVFEG